ncbi:MAG: RtcB family protein [Coriobacteriaceae bacterium]|nr:RtcB family protein [Coriobacteriaceae bacterium]
MRIIDTERLPIHVWGEDADEGTMRQTRNLANLPVARHHVALLPDAHVGFGMPIGGVLAAAGAVVPHAVGLDIGCGVRAWRTNVPAVELLRVRDGILNDIQRSVPQGFEWHATSQAERTDVFDEMPDVPALLAERDKAARQLGTLGGGNHFVELQVDSAGVVWAMIHSGSRNVGKLMADRYDAFAREAAARGGPDAVPLEWGLAHLSTESEAGAEYLAVMEWCLRFARENRRLMAEAVQRAVARHFPDESPDDALDVHHNYATAEEHFGELLIVHRKGAVRAEGRVIVPGSMGTASYIGEGIASPESFESCSHGAGRAMGRKQAVRTIPRERVVAQLEERGVRLFKARRRDLAEEAPEAYKDIEAVMRAQADLVEPLVRLTPIGVVKG